MPIVVARFAGTPELPAAVEASVRAQQASGDAAMYGLAAARLLERVVLGDSVKEVRRGAARAAHAAHAVASCVCAARACARRGMRSEGACAQVLHAAAWCMRSCVACARTVHVLVWSPPPSPPPALAARAAGRRRGMPCHAMHATAALPVPCTAPRPSPGPLS